MLTRLKINGLFKLYSYDLSFQAEEDDCITILTGPNGYGKTTLLNLINALYNTDYMTLFSIPFDSIEFQFEDKILTIQQSVKKYHISEESDDSADEEITLKLEFGDESGEKDIFNLSLVAGQIIGTPSEKFELYMQTQTVLYVRDMRLVIGRDDRGNYSGFMDTEVITRVALDIKSILNENQVFENPLNADGQIGDKLRLFNQIIRDACFADKEMIIDCISGLKFRNSLNEFISLSQLSSGEKHILVQTYELIFKAKSGTLAIVDTPELFFHPVWLVQYVDNIKKIQDLKSKFDQPLQVVLATHSPELIGERWDITCDFYEQRIK